MYTYDNNNNLIIFEGDLTEYLVQYGISIEHIDRMKAKILEADKNAYYSVHDLEQSGREYTDLVPLNKVIGTSRGTVGWSVYENVRAMYKGDRAEYKFEESLNLLKQMSLTELRKSYEELLYPVEMIYYVDDDEYFLIGDGNHRTLTAMLVGAKYIRAKIRNGYCDNEKKEKYLCSKSFLEKYKIERIMRRVNNIYDISFKDDNGVFEVSGYPGPKLDEDLFSFLGRISMMIDSDISSANNLKKMPVFSQKMFLHNEKNYRVKQYIDKKYLSVDERIFWNNREPIILYDL